MRERSNQNTELLVETTSGIVVRIVGDTALIPVGAHGEVWRGPFSVNPGEAIAVHGPRGREQLTHLGTVVSTFQLI